MKNSSALSKKIVAGKYKGKTIMLPSKETTRSSKTIVLESLFNTLQFDIVDATFVELFSGSGSVGLEALSRGAGQIIFMEKDYAALKVLKRNIAQLEPSKTKVIGGDTFVNIEQVKAMLQRDNVRAYFYIDPPFSYREEMEDIYDKMIELIENLDEVLVEMLIIEHMSTLKLQDNMGAFTCKKRKKFGKTTLSYYVAKEM